MDALTASITTKTKAIIYNNYQNPNGAQSSQAEMEALAALAIKHDLWVLADDAYYEIRKFYTVNSIPVRLTLNPINLPADVKFKSCNQGLFKRPY